MAILVSTQVTGSLGVTGQIVAPGITSSLLGNVIGTSSWATTAISSLTASTLIFSAPYVTLSTSSNNAVTASFLYSEQYVNLVTGSVIYTITCSNTPDAGQVSKTDVYFNNTAAETSSLSFPTDWKFIGVSPSSITASKVGLLSLKAYGSSIVAVWGQQY